MAWQGSPTAVTGCPCRRRTAPASSSRWATEVSWYSSSRTTRNCSRRIAPTPGCSRARRRRTARSGRRSRAGRGGASPRGRRSTSSAQLAGAAGGLAAPCARRRPAWAVDADLSASSSRRRARAAARPSRGARPARRRARARSPTRSGRDLVERRVRAGRGAQHPRGELEAGGVGEQPGAGLEADPQAVVAAAAGRRRRGRCEIGSARPAGRRSRRPARRVGVGWTPRPAARAPCAPARRARPAPCW